MKYTIYFHPHAESEIDDAAEFIDRESPGLGAAFLSAVQRAVDQIRSNPESAS